MTVRVLLVVLACGLAMSACHSTGVTRFVLRDEGDVRKRLVVNGVPIRGEVTIVERGESTFINGILWPWHAQATPRPTYRKLDSDDSLRLLRIPYVARRAPRTGPLLPVVNAYFARRMESALDALATYEREVNRTGDTARAIARARGRLDPEIVDVSAGESAATFDCCGMRFHAHGFGSEGLGKIGPAPAFRGSSRSERVTTLRRALTERGMTTVAWLDDISYLYEGESAGRLAADQVDAALDPDTLRGNRRWDSIVHTQAGLPPRALSRLRAQRVPATSQ